jgi:hypothetical protein
LLTLLICTSRIHGARAAGDIAAGARRTEPSLALPRRREALGRNAVTANPGNARVAIAVRDRLHGNACRVHAGSAAASQDDLITGNARQAPEHSTWRVARLGQR